MNRNLNIVFILACLFGGHGLDMVFGTMWLCTIGVTIVYFICIALYQRDLEELEKKEKEVEEIKLHKNLNGFAIKRVKYKDSV